MPLSYFEVPAIFRARNCFHTFQSNCRSKTARTWACSHVFVYLNEVKHENSMIFKSWWHQTYKVILRVERRIHWRVDCITAVWENQNSSRSACLALGMILIKAANWSPLGSSLFNCEEWRNSPNDCFIISLFFSWSNCLNACTDHIISCCYLFIWEMARHVRIQAGCSKQSPV